MEQGPAYNPPESEITQSPVDYKALESTLYTRSRDWLKHNADSILGVVALLALLYHVTFYFSFGKKIEKFGNAESERFEIFYQEIEEIRLERARKNRERYLNSLEKLEKKEEPKEEIELETKELEPFAPPDLEEIVTPEPFV